MPGEPTNATLDRLRRIDRLCLRFEREWLQGRVPSLDQFLGEVDADEQGALLAELLPLEWVYRKQRDEKPARQDYLARFPQHRDVIEQAWALWMVTPTTAGPVPGIGSPLLPVLTPRGGGRRWYVIVVVLAAIVLALGIAWWATRPAPPSDVAAPPPPLQIRLLHVRHFVAADGQVQLKGIVGHESFGVRQGDSLGVSVDLSEPAHVALLALDSEGALRRLWPEPSGPAPAPLSALHYPASKGRLLQIAGEPGFLVFAVVASRSPLQAISDGGQRKWRWPQAARGVWISDGQGVYPALPGVEVVRGGGKTPGAPALDELGRELRDESGAEVVEVVAFPVRGNEPED